MSQSIQLEQIAERVLQQVSAAGAEGDLIIDESDTLSLRASQGRLEEHKVSQTRVLGLRVIKDQQVGTAYSEATDEGALTALVNQAMTNARFARPTPEEVLLPNAGAMHTDDSQLCPDVDQPITEQIEQVLSLERDLASRPQIRNVPHCALSHTLSARRVCSTAGLDARTRQRMHVVYAAALAEQGERTAMEGQGQVDRRPDKFDIGLLAEQVWQHSTALLSGEPVPSGAYDVIFAPDCQSQLWGVFALAFSGKSAQDGINPWRDKVGAVLADPRLTLIDAPTCSDGLGYALFDDEGTPTRDLVVLDQGRLNTLLHNGATARHFGLTSTGHGTRGPRSTLGVNAHQWQILPGETELSSLQQGQYLELTGLTGLHSGANAISGDFSFGASGFLCKDGERLKPVRGITVAGNFYQMLNRIAAIGDTTHWNWQRSSLMPDIRFSDVAISG